MRYTMIVKQDSLADKDDLILINLKTLTLHWCICISLYLFIYSPWQTLADLNYLHALYKILLHIDIFMSAEDCHVNETIQLLWIRASDKFY